MMDGVRVVELGLFALVPAAAAVLAEWGADVVKVEHPVHGDPVRGLAAWGIKPGTGGFSYMWEICNRGKRSIGVDLATPEGLEIVLSLAERADVFLTSFLPSARRKLGIDVEHVMARNPTIIYGRGSGQGPKGDEADAGGFDGAAYWFRSGVGSAAMPVGSEEPIALPSPGFGDLQTGMHLAGGIAAALWRRERTGKGAVVDTSLLASGLWAMQGAVAGSAAAGTAELPKRARPDVTNPLTVAYPTADGRFVALMMLGSDRYWPGLCQAIGRPDLLTDARFATARDRAAHSAECVAALDAVFCAQPLDHWRTALAGQEGPWAVVAHAAEATVDQQARSNGYIQDVDYGDGRSIPMIAAPVQFEETAPTLRPAPEHGAHTEEVLL
ncbi:MAG TPA: CoA transferase, partial [Acidimicrobiia bacterium]|nr:CoA transferase [Acidimicrobiia bacterium]